MAKVNAYKIKYEIRNNKDYPDWQCYIIGEDQNDAINHLQSYIKAPIMVHEVSHICRIDSITDKLREFLVPVKTQNKKEFKCETCNKEFPTEHALKIHNTKKHS